MTKHYLRRAMPVLILTGAALPAGSAMASTSARSHAAPAARAKKFKGPVVDMRWGPVQAIITVKNKKITSVSISTSPENARSQFIDDQAVPMLQQETLQAQSASIDEISGATMTSGAYIESLQSAVKKVRQQKALE